MKYRVSMGLYGVILKDNGDELPSINGGLHGHRDTPTSWMVDFMENTNLKWKLGVPLFQETSI